MSAEFWKKNCRQCLQYSNFIDLSRKSDIKEGSQTAVLKEYWTKKILEGGSS